MSKCDKFENYCDEKDIMPCLIPKPEAKAALICHENSYCKCDLKDFWDASEEIARKSERERVLDEVRAFIEIVANNYYKATMFDHSSAASCIAEELKQKYGGSD